MYALSFQNVYDVMCRRTAPAQQTIVPVQKPRRSFWDKLKSGVRKFVDAVKPLVEVVPVITAISKIFSFFGARRVAI